MLRKQLAKDKDVDRLEILFALLRRHHNTELYHGYSPKQLIFGRNKSWLNLRYNHPRECKDASALLDDIQAGETEAKCLIEKFQAHWFSIANQGRKEPQDLEKTYRVWLRKSETTRVESPNFSPCGTVPVKLCPESKGTVFTFVWTWIGSWR